MSRYLRQKATADWITRTFGAHIQDDPLERAARFLEEALELAQAVGLAELTARRLFKHVYDRPKGEVAQEVGGVSVTLLALCHNLHLDADLCEQAELQRVLAIDPEAFRARHAAKAKAGVALL